ncbi:hypothetical protein D3C86_1625250 [compost metagenome]
MTNGVHQAFTRAGRRHAARGARQQPNLQPLFKPGNSLAQRGLRDTQVGCRPGKAAFPGDCYKGQKVVQIMSWHQGGLDKLISSAYSFNKLSLDYQA